MPDPLTTRTVASFDDVVASTQAGSRAPSLIAGVVRGGALVHVATAGQTPRPDRDTQYRIGSITKIFTAVLVLGLRDEGRLDLDDLVVDHLPGLDLPGVRMRALLGQASGLQREPDGRWWERHAGGGVDELLAGVGPHKLAFGPYQRYHYSNLGYGLLGAVVERHTGGTWWEAVRTRLLEPLGMRRTTYQASEPFARGYVAHPWHHTLREEPREDHGAMAPAGQLWSTVDDLAQLAAALAGHRPEVLAPGTLDLMAQPVAIADPESWTRGYGLGLQLARSGNRVYIGHTGSMPGYLANVLVHRGSGTGVVVFTNTYTLPGSAIGRVGVRLLDLVLDTEPVPARTWLPAAAPPPAPIAPLCGRWWWMGREYEARWDGVALVLQGTAAGAEAWSFTPEGPDRWRGRTGEQAGEVLAVLRDAHGNVVGLDLATFVFRRAPLDD
jgi:CubicO group peptidase (beta-lactamase class C family)